jgi:tetratricopeptide (TPR) repeat protein
VIIGPGKASAQPTPEEVRALLNSVVENVGSRRYQEALDTAEEALRLARLTDDQKVVADALSFLAVAQSSIGHIENARATFTSALAALRKAYGPRHLNVAGALKN